MSTEKKIEEILRNQIVIMEAINTLFRAIPDPLFTGLVCDRKADLQRRIKDQSDDRV